MQQQEQPRRRRHLHVGGSSPLTWRPAKRCSRRSRHSGSSSSSSPSTWRQQLQQPQLTSSRRSKHSRRSSNMRTRQAAPTLRRPTQACTMRTRLVQPRRMELLQAIQAMHRRRAPRPATLQPRSTLASMACPRVHLARTLLTHRRPTERPWAPCRRRTQPMAPGLLRSSTLASSPLGTTRPRPARHLARPQGRTLRRRERLALTRRRPDQARPLFLALLRLLHSVLDISAVHAPCSLPRETRPGPVAVPSSALVCVATIAYYPCRSLQARMCTTRLRLQPRRRQSRSRRALTPCHSRQVRPGSQLAMMLTLGMHRCLHRRVDAPAAVRPSQSSNRSGWQGDACSSSMLVQADMPVQSTALAIPCWCMEHASNGWIAFAGSALFTISQLPALPSGSHPKAAGGPNPMCLPCIPAALPAVASPGFPDPLQASSPSWLKRS